MSPSITLRTGSEPLDVTKGDSVTRGERNRYKLHATEGEHLKVSISALEDNAVFQVLGPDNKALPGTEEGQDARSWEGTIPATGDYVIEVAGTRGNSTYSLSLTIS